MRLANYVLAMGVLVAASLAAGCSGMPGATGTVGPRPGSPGSVVATGSAPATLTIAEADTGTPQTVLPAEVPLALPLVDGEPVRDPAEEAVTRAQLLRPGQVILLTPPAIRLIGAQDVTMTVHVREFVSDPDGALVSVLDLEAPAPTQWGGRPAVLFLPKGTLVRVLFPDVRRGDETVTIEPIRPGRSLALGVTFRYEPGGMKVRLRSVR